jgi:hypothetical protein
MEGAKVEVHKIEKGGEGFQAKQPIVHNIKTRRLEP